VLESQIFLGWTSQAGGPAVIFHIDWRKMMPALRTFVALLVFALSSIAHLGFADDGGFEGDGANVYPITNSEIQMVSETIDIRYSMVKYRWFVDVTMHFHNHGSATIVQMGFPFKEPFGPDINEADDAPVNSKKEEGLPFNFLSYVNGKPIKTVIKRGVLNPALPTDIFEHVMVFTVPFEAGEDKAIRHTYYIGGDRYSDGYNRISYILRTGALWRDDIADCLITVEMPITLANSYPIVSPKEHRASLKGEIIKLHWRYKNLKPDFDIQIESLPGNVKELSTEELLNQLKVDDKYLEPHHIRYFRNRIYAGYGRKFDNPYIRAQFINTPGQDGKKKFASELISPKDKELLQFFTFIEKERESE
jgi:hypothetical protein